MATSDFQNFFEVATGPCKNAVNLACGHFLSSLFSLLSFLLRMSKLACSFPMPMQISSNVSAPVLISADLCRMSQPARAPLLRRDGVRTTGPCKNAPRVERKPCHSVSLRPGFERKPCLSVSVPWFINPVSQSVGYVQKAAVADLWRSFL